MWWNITYFLLDLWFKTYFMIYGFVVKNTLWQDNFVAKINSRWKFKFMWKIDHGKSNKVKEIRNTFGMWKKLKFFLLWKIYFILMTDKKYFISDFKIKSEFFWFWFKIFEVKKVSRLLLKVIWFYYVGRNLFSLWKLWLVCDVLIEFILSIPTNYRCTNKSNYQ